MLFLAVLFPSLISQAAYLLLSLSCSSHSLAPPSLKFMSAKAVYLTFLPQADHTNEDGKYPVFWGTCPPHGLLALCLFPVVNVRKRELSHQTRCKRPWFPCLHGLYWYSCHLCKFRGCAVLKNKMLCPVFSPAWQILLSGASTPATPLGPRGGILFFFVFLKSEYGNPSYPWMGYFMIMLPCIFINHWLYDVTSDTFCFFRDNTACYWKMWKQSAVCSPHLLHDSKAVKGASVWSPRDLWARVRVRWYRMPGRPLFVCSSIIHH